MSRKDYIMFADKVVELKIEFPDSTFPKLFEDKVLEVLKQEPAFSIKKWKAYICRKMAKKKLDTAGV